MIGYSLGGGIAADFAAYFPNLVKGLVLLAPGGLVRKEHFGRQSKLLYSGWLPNWLRERLVRKRLGGGSSNASSVKQDVAEKAVQEELKRSSSQGFDNTLLSKNRPGVTVGGVTDVSNSRPLLICSPIILSFISCTSIYSIYFPKRKCYSRNLLEQKITDSPVLQWQLANHEGFVRSFVSSIRFASIQGAHERWRKLGVLKNKVIVMAGQSDPIM